jgi:hypothetical protein
MSLIFLRTELTHKEDHGLFSSLWLPSKQTEEHNIEDILQLNIGNLMKSESDRELFTRLKISKMIPFPTYSTAVFCSMLEVLLFLFLLFHQLYLSS